MIFSISEDSIVEFAEVIVENELEYLLKYYNMDKNMPFN